MLKSSRAHNHECPSDHLDDALLWRSEHSKTGLERKLLLPIRTQILKPSQSFCIQDAVHDHNTRNKSIM